MCCGDILIADRVPSVVIDGEHHVKLEQVHKLNKQACCRRQEEAVSIDTPFVELEGLMGAVT